MPTSALALALAAAALHAGWNLVLARARDVQAATATAFAVAVVAFAPAAVATWDVHADALPYAIPSAALELAYLVLLATAYARADLSVVYPIARGAAPVLVLLVGVAALGRGTNLAEAAGVAVVAAGILLVRGVGRGRGAGLGLVIASVIAGYTILDSYGIDHADPLGYLEVVLAPPALLYLAWIARRRGGAAVRGELSLPVVLAGVAAAGAYALALAALRLASAASVAAVRETSVVIAVVLARTVLRERVGARRVAGAIAVAAGIALLSL